MKTRCSQRLVGDGGHSRAHITAGQQRAEVTHLHFFVAWFRVSISLIHSSSSPVVDRKSVVAEQQTADKVLAGETSMAGDRSREAGKPLSTGPGSDAVCDLSQLPFENGFHASWGFVGLAVRGEAPIALIYRMSPPSVDSVAGKACYPHG